MNLATQSSASSERRESGRAFQSLIVWGKKLPIGCVNSILWDYESVWHIWPQNKCRSLWPIFHGPVILPYILKSVWCMNIRLQDDESVWPDIWPQNKCRSLWPILHALVILPYILKTICCMKIVPWDYKSAWHDFWPQNVGHWDLISWYSDFCLISWKLFSG